MRGAGYVREMKTTTQAEDPAAYAQLQEMVRDIDVAMITTVTPDGALHSRPMVTRHFNEQGEIWFLLRDDVDAVEDLEAEHAVNVNYSSPEKRRYVSIRGSGTVFHDHDKAQELWDDALKAYFPQGLDDPHLAVLRVQIEIAEFWESPSQAATQLMARERADSSPSTGIHTKLAVRATPATG